MDAPVVSCIDLIVVPPLPMIKPTSASGTSTFTNAWPAASASETFPSLPAPGGPPPAERMRSCNMNQR